MNSALDRGARCRLEATAAGITLSPGGGGHETVSTPLMGLGQDGMASYERAYDDELAAVMAWGFRHMQAEKGGAVYLRLSTRPLDQPKREMSAGYECGIGLERFNDVKVGDVIECFRLDAVKRTLSSAPRAEAAGARP